jgi:23S rRNA pseudouridine1911/1915/1917 synthase
MTRRLTVPSDAAPQRLDRFLAGTLPSGSRRTAQRAIALGQVQVNGRPARKGESVRAGDAVTLPEDLWAPAALQPNPRLQIPVLYEDAAVIAVDKPAGVPSHALRAEETETVANFLLARFPELASIGAAAFEPGLVHRLDTATSGVLLAARTAAAFRSLRRQFRDHSVEKEYRAVVEGDVRRAGEIHTPIAHAAHNRRKMRVVAVGTARARAAETSYRPVERFGHATLLAVQIRTGVMHQIRVHLASIGHPVVGDALYGRAGGLHAPRHLLHASRLGLTHPANGRRLEIRSPLPADFVEGLEGLRRRGC